MPPSSYYWQRSALTQISAVGTERSWYVSESRFHIYRVQKGSEKVKVHIKERYFSDKFCGRIGEYQTAQSDLGTTTHFLGVIIGVSLTSMVVTLTQMTALSNLFWMAVTTWRIVVRFSSFPPLPPLFSPSENSVQIEDGLLSAVPGPRRPLRRRAFVPLASSTSPSPVVSFF